MAGGERLGRAGVNAFINVEAALAGTAQQVTEKGKQVCVQIGPGVERAVVQGKAAVRQGVGEVTAATHNAKAALVDGVNQFQVAIINDINQVRAAINGKFLAIVALGDRTLEEAIGGMSQAELHGIIKQFMRFAKLIYASQLAVGWSAARPHPLLLKKGTKAATGAVLGPTQPREPWQDVHCEIRGPAVDDVARNFIDRWNAAQKSYLSEQTLKDVGPLIRAVFESRPGFIKTGLLIPAHLVPVPRPPQEKEPPTNVAVRVLRSAPLKMCVQEAQARGDKVMPVKEQREIQTQMVNLIRGATDFIYIENQFYQTECGTPSIDVFSPDSGLLTSGPMKVMKLKRMNRIKSEISSAGNAGGKMLLPTNEIGKALGDRIAHAIRRDQPFHVYMVLPVHPEGTLDDITVVGQIHWTMQSLVFANQSLINRVRRAIAARRMCKNSLSSEDAWERALAGAGARTNGIAPYEKISETHWSKYLTLLNLRTCELVDKVVRTEQVYIHSKLLIVDDRHVVIGSANINDRSQSGKRDSEIAVMLLDTKKTKKQLRDATTHVNALARNLRVNIWRKHFALDRKLEPHERANSIVVAATEMEAMIELPAADATIKAIQKLARRNAEIYVETFPHVPWSTTNDEGTENGASIWPVCPKGIGAEKAEKLASLMPFHKDFWLPPKVPVKAPVGIRGFFTKLPTNWTIGENNHPEKLSVMVLTHNEHQKNQLLPFGPAAQDLKNA
ncbi:MAG: phospholipase D-like domain-containing protein [Pseudomonadota bacterium]